MYQDICINKNEYGIIETDDVMIKPHEEINCNIEPVGSRMKEVWISSGVTKGFPYLDSFNTG